MQLCSNPLLLQAAIHTLHEGELTHTTAVHWYVVQAAITTASHLRTTPSQISNESIYKGLEYTQVMTNNVSPRHVHAYACAQNPSNHLYLGLSPALDTSTQASVSLILILTIVLASQSGRPIASFFGFN